MNRYQSNNWQRLHIIRKPMGRKNNTIGKFSHDWLTISLTTNKVETFWKRPFTLAWKTQMHRSTNTSTYRLILSRLTQWLFLLHTNTGGIRPPKLEVSQHQIRAIHYAPNLALWVKTNTNLRTLQERHIHTYGHSLRKASVFYTGEYVSVEKPPLINRIRFVHQKARVESLNFSSI